MRWSQARRIARQVASTLNSQCCFAGGIKSSGQSALSSTAHRSWDVVCCKLRVETLWNGTTDLVERARLFALFSPGFGDWLNTQPLANVGLEIDNSIVRIAAGLRLGAPIVHSHICVCGRTVTVDGHRGLSVIGRFRSLLLNWERTSRRRHRFRVSDCFTSSAKNSFLFRVSYPDSSSSSSSSMNVNAALIVFQEDCRAAVTQ